MKRYFAVGLGMVCLYHVAQGALYTGNGDTSFGGAIGRGNLVLTDNGTTVSGTITKGAGNFADVLVIYIDSKTGGFNTTKNFTDSSTSLTKAVSGVDANPANRATANFVSTFFADYAIALRPASTVDGELFQLVNNGDLIPVRSVNLSPLNNVSSSTYTFSFNLADIGAPSVSFNIEATYIGQNGFRSLESFESVDGFTGWDTVAFNTFHTYNLAPVPETTNASLAIFGGIALCAGVFARTRSYFKKLRIAETN
jgi:hypothetical protein